MNSIFYLILLIAYWIALFKLTSRLDALFKENRIEYLRTHSNSSAWIIAVLSWAFIILNFRPESLKVILTVSYWGVIFVFANICRKRSETKPLSLTAEEFNKLDNIPRAKVWSENSKLLFHRKINEDYTVYVYKLFDFYIESVHDTKEKKVKYMNALTDGKVLEGYLNNIDVYDIYAQLE